MRIKFYIKRYKQQKLSFWCLKNKKKIPSFAYQKVRKNLGIYQRIKNL